MGDEQLGEDLLCGPRGRRLCLSLLTSASPSLWTLVRRAAMSPADVEQAAELTRAVTELDAKGSGPTEEPALMEALSATVNAARYWQEPDEEDLLLEDPYLRAALEPVAREVAGSASAAWWSSPVALDHQQYVQWADESQLDPPALTGATVRLAKWHASALTSERRAAERPKAVTANWSGAWWSTPALSHVVTTTRSRPGLGAAKLMLVEDSLGWNKARVWPLKPTTECRVYEITGPTAWTDLVGRYPMDVSFSKRHDWWRVTGHDGAWLIPDWAAVASDYDAVHLTVSGYLTAAGRALPVDNSRSVMAGWNPDETYWLSDVLGPAGVPVEWHRDESQPSNGNWSRNAR